MQRSRHPVLIVVTMFAACASTPAQPEPRAHGHRHSTMLTVTPGALLPGPVLHIPRMSTVVWRNRTADTVTILVAATTCGSCETVLGFASCAEGARSGDVAPGSVATLCFHEAGSFDFVTRGGAVEQRGTIVVEGEQP